MSSGYDYMATQRADDEVFSQDPNPLIPDPAGFDETEDPVPPTDSETDTEALCELPVLRRSDSLTEPPSLVQRWIADDDRMWYATAQAMILCDCDACKFTPTNPGAPRLHPVPRDCDAWQLTPMAPSYSPTSPTGGTAVTCPGAPRRLLVPRNLLPDDIIDFDQTERRLLFPHMYRRCVQTRQSL